MTLAPNPPGRPRRRWPLDDQGGFVMVMVVMLLLTIAVAGATGYQLVQVEADLASGAEEGEVALTAARAALERYVGEHLGVPGDTTTYVIGDADVSVIPRRIAAFTDPATPDLYLLEATAEVVDPRFPNSPARRTVRQHARLVKNAINAKGTVMSIAGRVEFYDLTSSIHGDDQSPFGGRGSAMSLTTGNCTGTAPRHILGTVSRSVAGLNPNSGDELALATVQAVIDTASAAWPVISSSNFAVPHQWGVNWPDFATYPDSFFVARYDGNLAAGPAHSGRGVLIVTGTLSITPVPFQGFSWDGIVLADATPAILSGIISSHAIRGALITGLGGVGNPAVLMLGSVASAVSVHNYSCYIAEANRVIAYLDLVDGSRWEL